ncbi:MAG: rhodanese-like domain-containing protein [Phycisphaerae bacterium]|nr:rhodanese-like domain-containing protein [Tepidisphaeraceae bacterium]
MSVRTITPAEVADRMMHDPAGRLIDVRTPAEFATVHAEGARSIPLDHLDPPAVMAAGDGLADGPVYVICKSGGRAAKACERFHAAGFTDVLSVAGGTDAWARAGLPVVRGTSGVISLERQVRIGAGLLVLTGMVLGWHVHPAFHWLSAVIGGGLVFAGVTDWCGMGVLLARMPWNRRGAAAGSPVAVPPPARDRTESATFRGG